ncbi:voltage-gated potassium channel [Syntrophus gentianae]|uniref:Voltage-gated potassium channel n=1 Tax=Syntrophus gentianae TaxID=43775 RepID=A0A1H7V7H7_9BACT|nr:potassium channel protein [Syntrophus gentianae]SEM05193.1 voltage-gated potassium channel [Syntrophus gentianae]
MLKKKLLIASFLLFLILVLGTVGYVLIEGWGIIESFYMTVTTISTVGYGDFTPATWQGRLFTVLLVLFGVGTMLYSVSMFAEMMVEDRLKKVLGRGSMENRIERMKNHYIICGFGRMGSLICRELAEEKAPFVVIEKNPDIIQRLEDEGYVYLKGDATDDKSLLRAGIRRAQGVVCVLSTDAENLYTILTSKELNAGIYILSRCEEEVSEHRLLRAGADRVISPYKMGGMRMAMAILKPAMMDFIEITTRRQSLELRMEEMPLSEDSAIIGRSLEAAEIRKSYGLIIVAIKKDSGKMIFNPPAGYVIEKGDRLIALGEDEDVNRFNQVCMVP